MVLGRNEFKALAEFMIERGARQAHPECTDRVARRKLVRLFIM